MFVQKKRQAYKNVIMAKQTSCIIYACAVIDFERVLRSVLSIAEKLVMLEC